MTDSPAPLAPAASPPDPNLPARASPPLDGKPPAAPALPPPPAKLLVGELDARGVKIKKVFVGITGEYAIYRAEDRIMVAFADDPALAREQRKRLVPIAGLRSKLAYLTWQVAGEDYAGEDYYDGQAAHAIQLALDGAEKEAEAVLLDSIALAERERASLGRLQYLKWGAVVSVGLAALLLMVAGQLTGDAYNLCLGAVGGVAGAMFSICTAIRSRAVALDLDRRSNITDGVLRILVGTLGAGALILFLTTGVLKDLQFGAVAFSGSTMKMQVVLVIGFLAGFLERLVPSILETRAPPPGSGPTGSGAPQSVG